MEDELIDLVDKNDNIIGEVLKSDAHENKLWHREVGVIIVNDKREVLFQQRSENKRYPLLWVISAGGHIGKGESPEKAAYRELKEELGIETKLKFIEKKGRNGKFERNYIYWFIGKYNEEITNILESEIKKIEFFSKEKFIKFFKIASVSELEGKGGFLNQISVYASRIAHRYWNGEIDTN